VLTSTQKSPSFVRTAYTVPTLEHHADLQQKGVPGLFTPRGFKTAYTDYQQHMVDELHASTDGMRPAPMRTSTCQQLTGVGRHAV
jgi:Fe-Mn family superoxide dismutase